MGIEKGEEDNIPFHDKMNLLTEKLAEQFTKGAELEGKIKNNLKEIGYGASF